MKYIVFTVILYGAYLITAVVGSLLSIALFFNRTNITINSGIMTRAGARPGSFLAVFYMLKRTPERRF